MSGVFDHAGSLERMGGDEQLFSEMVGFFVEDAPRWLAQIKEGIAQGDASLVHRSAHTLKGLVANFGAAAAQSAAGRIETLAQQDPTLQAVASEVPPLEVAIDELHAALAPYHQPPDVAAR
jgi:HPt (histidine-containing phosphotransfer) domain-containing protein